MLFFVFLIKCGFYLNLKKNVMNYCEEFMKIVLDRGCFNFK